MSAPVPRAAPTPASPPSTLSAWLFLVWLSWKRQARVRNMVVLSVALLGVMLLVVVTIRLTAGFGM